MRVIDGSGKFGSSRTLSITPPATPAAVPLYARTGRTHLLAFDLDAKGHSPAEVDTDVDRLLTWLSECGGRWITDRSTSGGRHVLVPLALGSAMTVDDIAPLMRLLAARLPTLDITPMLNAATGCITVPGSACRKGGYRVLLGSLDDALDALTVRSAPGLVMRLVAQLGGGATSRDDSTPDSQVGAIRAAAAAIDHADRTTGSGPHARLNPDYHRTTPLPPPVAAYAATGVLDVGRWHSHSEARQSVITHAVLRGANAVEIQAAMTTDEWAGVRQAYARYGASTSNAIQRDVSNALNWAATNVTEVRQLLHKNKHTGGDDSFVGEQVRTRWLAHATAWAEREFIGHRGRTTVLAVLQALAYASAVAGEVIEGVPVVAMGGRGLSLAAGLMREMTVLSVLRALRDTEGSPVLLVRRGAGRDADRYALTTPAVQAPTAGQIARTRVEPVSAAWSVLGIRGRALYEELLHRTPARSTVDEPETGCALDDLFAAARIGRSAGHEIIADLVVAGLITKTGPGRVGRGHRTLDDVAAGAGIDRIREERITRHRAERIVWHAWLDARFDCPPPEIHTDFEPEHAWSTSAADTQRSAKPDPWLAAVLATGPPHQDPTETALDLLSELLGARIVTVG